MDKCLKKKVTHLLQWLQKKAIPLHVKDQGSLHECGEVPREEKHESRADWARASTWGAKGANHVQKPVKSEIRLRTMSVRKNVTQSWKLSCNHHGRVFKVRLNSCILLCRPLQAYLILLHFLQIEGKTLHQQRDYNSLKAQVMVSIF